MLRCGLLQWRQVLQTHTVQRYVGVLHTAFVSFDRRSGDEEAGSIGRWRTGWNRGTGWRRTSYAASCATKLSGPHNRCVLFSELITIIMITMAMVNVRVGLEGGRSPLEVRAPRHGAGRRTEQMIGVEEHGKPRQVRLRGHDQETG